MNDAHTLLATNLISFASKKPNRQEMVNWLSQNLSPTEIKPAVFTFHANSDGIIKLDHYAGFDQNTKLLELEISIDADRPASNVLREIGRAHV